MFKLSFRLLSRKRNRLAMKEEGEETGDGDGDVDVDVDVDDGDVDGEGDEDEDEGEGEDDADGGGGVDIDIDADGDDVDGDADVDGNGDGDADGAVDGNEDGEGDAGEEGADVTLPQADLFLSMIYPPALYITEKTVGRIQDGPKQACPHGLWEPKHLPDPQKNQIDKEKVKEFEPSPALRSRIDQLSPQLTDKMTNLDHLKKEFNKHGGNLLFLTSVRAYIEFALDVYERYNFVRITDYVVDRIEEEGIGQQVEFYGMTWVGVRLGDFLRIIQSFPEISRFKDSVGVQLFKDSDQYMFYEINMNFTEDKRPAMRCRKTPEVYVNGKKKEAPNISHDLLVIMMGKKVTKENSYLWEGECSNSNKRRRQNCSWEMGESSTSSSSD